MCNNKKIRLFIQNVNETETQCIGRQHQHSKRCLILYSSYTKVYGNTEKTKDSEQTFFGLYFAKEQPRKVFFASIKESLQSQYLSQQEFFLKHVFCVEILVNEGQRFIYRQYSSVRNKKPHRQFYSRQKIVESPSKILQLRHENIPSQRKKRQQGGIQSFWMFKKKMQIEEKRMKDKINGQNDIETYQQPQVDRTQVAYKRILTWGKMSTDGLIPKNLLKNYIASKLGENFASWFINFYQFRAYTTQKQFEQVCERFKSMKTRESHVVTFFLYDKNGDSFICPKDVFGVFERQLSQKIERDVLRIAEFLKSNTGRKELINENFKIQHVVIRDDWLTVKDYEMYFKKVDEPYLKAAGKKDTAFSKTFAVLDHRQKVRSVRKQMNRKKTMYDQLYDQLYGEIAKERKAHAFISADDYKLNFTFLHEIFEEEKSQLFEYCCDFIFNF